MTNGSATLVLDALGDATRRGIVERLADRPQGVQELADGLPVTRSAVSQHLKVLRSAGLVNDEAAGTRRIYSLRPRGVEVLRDYLDRVWATGLGEYRRAAAQHAGEREDPDHG